MIVIGRELTVSVPLTGVTSNYTITPVKGTLTVNSRPITITANNQGKTYGETFTFANTEYATSDGTLAAGQSMTLALASDGSAAAATVAGYDINISNVVIKNATDQVVTSNYTITPVKGTLTVNSRPITITANNQGKTYGETFTFANTEYATSDGTLAAGQSMTLALASDGSAAAATVAGYDINISNVVIKNATDQVVTSNYTITPVKGTLTIDKATLTVTAADKNRLYGDANPVLTGTVTGQKNSESFTDTYLTSAVATSPIGDYDIVPSVSGATLTNYTVVPVNGKLIINKATLTVTAADKNKYIGQANPDFSGTVTGQKNNETFTVTYATIATVSSCEGSYPIIPTVTGATLANYSVTSISGSLVVTGLTNIDASYSSTPVQVGTTANLIAKVTPAVAGITVSFTLDNGTSATFPTYTATTDNTGTATATVTSLPIEVYKVTALIGTCVSSTAAYLAVYDPNGGFVTGGGWIQSPVGALVGTNTVGKANFGFNSKYEKGKTIPTGNTEFQFQAGNLNFSSSTYTTGSLVVSGSKATYKGVGTIKGLSGQFGFMVSAVDGNVSGGGGIDKFRIKIWVWGSPSNIIYDNNMGLDENDLPTTVLGGGSIVIHEVKNKAAFIPVEVPVVVVEPTIKAYPNPFTERLNIEFSSAKDAQAKLEIYGVTGAKLATLWDAPVSGGVLNKVEFVPNLVSSQMVFYHLTMDGKTQVGKVVFQERR